MPVHTGEIVVKRVVVHPLVLLSVVDHFNRMKNVGNARRVVGLLLGSLNHTTGELDVSNSFAVPFDEDEKNKSVWFLDHEYLENMYTMFKKVNAREKIVGWYHTGPKLNSNDLEINELIRKYNQNSVLVIIEVSPKKNELPAEAYIAVEEIRDDGTPVRVTFEHVPSEMGAEEAEEVGVEHLLRDIKDTTVGSLSQLVSNQLSGLKGLRTQLGGIVSYLQKVQNKELPLKPDIINNLQDIFNLLPNINAPSFTDAMTNKTNDQLMVIYLSTMVRSILAMHNLIDNKLRNKSEVEKKIKEKSDLVAKKAEKDKDEKVTDVKKEEEKKATK
ncbi:26S proteasome non-ATPase regulatory subunit 7-like [Paramacrobiotus metropolitanus]|uniref:26S proteasome non-ATPase regulatory subunit 7-like n=1 Tax=Paramacrobiotus metropolitanus TaxID=2943436 RepID=UPI0024460A3D|nr:26S proteasome non-ATPase regulatory subunit 7-like [Paramacrobiotus metropolitanus]